MINFDNIKNSILVKKPFKYTIINNCFPTEFLNEVLENIPHENYFRSIRNEGNDKTYNVINNILVKLGENSYNKENNLSQNLINFLNIITSKDYISAISNLLENNLTECFMEVTLKKYTYQDFISPHTDTEKVTATHMIFLNQTWEHSWGGELCLMNNPNDTFLNLPPLNTYSLAFVRSPASWHSVNQILNKQAQRVVIQVAFWNTKQRIVMPGRIDDSIK